MKRRTFWIGAGADAITVVLLAIFFIISGAMDMTASGEMSLIDRVGHTMWERSMVWRAPEEDNPFAGDASVIARGFEHYASMCVQCHGGPNVERAEWARFMHPLPPDLTSPEVQGRGDGTLFYIVRHGVRATGMPALSPDHSDEDCWHIVAFLRVLGGITEAQEHELRDAVGSGEHTHATDDETDTASGQEQTDTAGHDHEGDHH